MILNRDVSQLDHGMISLQKRGAEGFSPSLLEAWGRSHLTVMEDSAYVSPSRVSSLQIYTMKPNEYYLGLRILLGGSSHFHQSCGNRSMLTGARFKSAGFGGLPASQVPFARTDAFVRPISYLPLLATESPFAMCRHGAQLPTELELSLMKLVFRVTPDYQQPCGRKSWDYTFAVHSKNIPFKAALFPSFVKMPDPKP